VLERQLRWHEPPSAGDAALLRLDTDTDPATLVQRCDALATQWAAAAG
jgi:hypothetical protein